MTTEEVTWMKMRMPYELKCEHCKTAIQVNYNKFTAKDN
jgi:hypothetical protein